MKYKISFQQRAELALEQLSNQSPVTLTMAKKQIRLLKERSVGRAYKKKE